MTEGNIFRRALIGLALLFPLILSLSTVTHITATTIFTGDVPADFAEANAIIIVDNLEPDAADSSNELVVDSEPDVQMPSPPYARNKVSGWDVNALYIEYDPLLDMLFVGVDCFTICGDADDDGDPNRAGSTMRLADGADVANFGRFESVALLIDTDSDYRSLTRGDFEVVVGVSQLQDVDSFGTYAFTGATRAPYIGFGRRLPNPVTKYSIPNVSTPDLEFGIADFSQLPEFDFEPGDEFSFQIMFYAGSQRDGDIGEEFVPARAEAATVRVEESRRAMAVSVSAANTTVSTRVSIPSPTFTPPSVTPTYTPPPTPIPTPSPTPAPLSNDPPQRLQVPAIGVDTVIEPMGWSQVQQDDGTFATLWDVVDFAAGWHMNSSLPDRRGNVVLSGHNTIGGSVFRDLFQLQQGDDIVLLHDDQAHEYEINSVIVVPEQYASHEQRLENASYMGDFGDDRITLISCWPPGSASHRVIVIGEPAINPTSE